jgi:hypothetical protein
VGFGRVSPVCSVEEEEWFLTDAEFIGEDRVEVPASEGLGGMYHARRRKRTMFMILQYQLSTGGGGYILLEMRRSCGMSWYKSPQLKPGGVTYSCDSGFTSPIERVEIPVNITPNYS